MQRIALAVVPQVAAGMIRVLGSTLRYEDVYEGEPGSAPRGPGHEIPGPVVYAFWHRSLLCCAYRFRNLGIAILISRSFDGELVSRTVERLGFRAVRGSSSRGGTSGLRSMIEAYEQGHRCAIAVDGPRGPAMVAQPGASQLAVLAGAPWIGTFYARPLRAWTLKSWDRFLIPRPFTRVVMTWPAHVPAAGASVAELQPRLQAALDSAVERAEACVAKTAAHAE